MQTEFKLYKVDMKYIRNLHHIDDRVLSVSPQTGKDTRVFVGIVIVCGTHKYCIPLSSPKELKDRSGWKITGCSELQPDDPNRGSAAAAH